LKASAVEDDRLAVDRSRFGGREEDDRGSDLVGLEQAPSGVICSSSACASSAVRPVFATMFSTVRRVRSVST